MEIPEKFPNQSIYTDNNRQQITSQPDRCVRTIYIIRRFTTGSPYIDTFAFDGTWSRFPGQHRRGRAGHWRHAGSLTRAVPAALVLPRTGSSVDVDILVRQDLTNTHASELFSNQCPNLPGGYECTNGRAEHVEALHFAIGQPTVTSARALGAKCTRDPHTLLSPHPVQPCSVM